MKERERLSQLLLKNNLTLKGAELKTGILFSFIDKMKKGTRPISEENWIKILTGIEDMTRDEAKEQLAIWRLEDAQDELGEWMAKDNKNCLASSSEPARPYITQRDLEHYFKTQGLSEDEIKVLMVTFEAFKKRKK